VISENNENVRIDMKTGLILLHVSSNNLKRKTLRSREIMKEKTNWLMKGRKRDDQLCSLLWRFALPSSGLNHRVV
jgi:hypothetical protein